MIEIRRVRKSYDKYLALDTVSLKINDGEIFGLVGINGAGKSTLLRIMAGVFNSDEGSVLYDGAPVYDNPKAKKEIFFLPDDPYFSALTTGKELFELYATFYDMDRSKFEDLTSGYKLDLNKKVSSFSKGMRRQLFISLAIASHPKYLLLDEAFDGLDPKSRLQFKRAIIELQEECNTTVVISSHSLRELEEFCDTFGIIDNKRMSFGGNVSEEVEKIHKYQAVFSKTITEGDLSDIRIISFSRVGQVVNFVADGDPEEVKKKVERFEPILFEEISVDFEELFIYKTGGTKYE